MRHASFVIADDLVHLIAHILARHQYERAQHADRAVREHIQRVVDERIGPLVGKAVIGGVFAEIDRARDDVAEVAQRHAAQYPERQRDAVADDVGDRLQAVEHLAEQPSAQPHHRERERIVEDELQRVDDPRILHRVEHAVDKPAKHALANAEHVRIERDRQQREQRHRAAVRRVIHLDIRQTERQRDADRRIDDRHRVRPARMLLAVDEREQDRYADHQDDDDRDQHRLIVLGVGLALFEVLDDVGDRHRDRVQQHQADANRHHGTHLVTADKPRHRDRDDERRKQNQPQTHRRAEE